MSPCVAPERSSAPSAALTKFGRLTASSRSFIEAGSVTSRIALVAEVVDAAAGVDLHLERERAVGHAVAPEQRVRSRPSRAAPRPRRRRS